MMIRIIPRLLILLSFVFAFSCKNNQEIQQAVMDFSEENPIKSSTCPKNYLLINNLDDEVNESFCVAKYEMKNDSSTGLPISVKDGKPWVNISFNEAVDKCRELGTGYELINNDQWQVIARLIADIDENWMTGKAYTNEGTIFNKNFVFINSGNNKIYGEGKLLAAGADISPCFGYVRAFCSSQGSSNFYQKRTHTLPAGNIIWDFSGNASEWVAAGNDEMITGDNEIVSKMIYELDSNDILTAFYGNDEICIRPNIRNHYCGFGKFFLENELSTMSGGLRGGSFAEDAGIFSGSVHSSSLLSNATAWRGFRCVFTN